MSGSVSIVMTVFNRERYLREAIESVLSQTKENFEFVIWDDGSTDGSNVIAREYEDRDDRIRVFRSSRLGASPALRAAISETSGDYLGWVDSDDLLGGKAIEKTSAVLDSRPEVGLVYTDYTVIDAQGKSLGLGHHCARQFSKMAMLVEFITFHFRLIRRSVYDAVGGLDSSFECAYDYDLCLKLTEVTEVAHVKQPLYSYRSHILAASREKRFTQISCTHNAILNALKRRKLTDGYEIELDIVERYKLKRKKRARAKETLDTT